MSTWDWFDEYEWHARLAGDADRVRLAELHRDSYRFRECDPDRALGLLLEGRALAERLEEPWWSLYYDQQRVHALLHFKQDYRDVLDLAVRNTLAVRKPAFADFPRRLMIHGDLVSAYLGIDPAGYADAIRHAFDYLDAQSPPAGDDRYLLLGSQRQFALELGLLDEAHAFSVRSLELAGADADAGRARHFLVFTFSGLAEIAWRRGDLPALADAAREGEELARRVGHQVELAGFWLWQALLARQAGDERRAEALAAHARRRLTRMAMQPDSSYRDAECAFHELGGRLDLALAVREDELAGLRDRGRFAAECACRAKRAWLLRRLGRLSTEDLAEARRLAGRLRRPEPAFQALGQIERGEAP
jgi:hypothetical protein